MALGGVLQRWFGRKPADVEICRRWLDSGATDKALPALRRLAAEGDAEARFVLAGLYSSGRGVPLNLSESFRLLLQAGDAGHLGAAEELGALFLYGSSDVKAPLQAFEFRADLAGQREQALSALFDELRPYQDYREAARWNQLAADAGRPAAIARLGLQYALALGVEADPHQARKHLVNAATAGDDLGLIATGILFLGGFGGEVDLVEARRWLSKAKGDNGMTTVLLSVSYLTGPESSWDVEAARVLLQPVATEGNAAAMFYLGELYRNGHLPDDKGFAQLWLRRAAAKRHVKAIVSLVRLLTTGPKTSVLEAAALCREAADAGDLEAMFLLAHLYLDGRGVGQSDSFAYRWAQRSADGGFAQAAELLAWMTANGRGTEQNLPRARELLQNIRQPLSSEAEDLLALVRGSPTPARGG